MQGAADPTATQFVEIANMGSETVSLAGLELWNRRRQAVALPNESIEAGQRAVVVIGDAASLDIASGAPW